MLCLGGKERFVAPSFEIVSGLSGDDGRRVEPQWA